jgi:transcriptional regulator GlxA family with amidase domain
VNRIYVEKGEAPYYDIQIITADEEHGNSFHGYPMTSIKNDSTPDLILIPSFSTSNMQETIQKNAAFIPWLIKQYQNGAEIGSFCTGAFLLGATKLLDGRIATTHVDALRAFANAYPNITLKIDKTVTEDRKIYTSGGSTSSFHLLLHLVQKHCGKDIAVRIAKIFAIDMDRHRQSYFSTSLHRVVMVMNWWRWCRKNRNQLSPDRKPGRDRKRYSIQQAKPVAQIQTGYRYCAHRIPATGAGRSFQKITRTK